ncbi:MAG: multicopper oxidase domain-containing protein [Solirubrobacterales bacterium]|nr:multicopper oxidase domain-containing protein [Solirubrobacterales bacterium]
MTRDPLPDPLLPRRRFLQVGAASAFLCTIGGETVSLSRRGDAAKADAAAARVARPRAAGPTEQQTFTTPEPQPGGQVVEYWIQATTARWTIVPSRRDDWHGKKVPGASTFRAVVYQQMTPGFAAPLGPAAMPGPTLHAEVGDVLRVHFRNALPESLDQALTMHPHGVRYNPEYDGVYLGQYTRAGGFVAPGEEFTYTWEAVPESVGAWPYHDHGPNHTLNTMRGMFGGLVIRPKGEPVPAVEKVLFLHSLAPPVTGLKRQFQCINGRSFAGNTPTITAKVGQEVALHAIGMDNNFHDFHIHGHRWKDSRGGGHTDNPTLGPNETVTARFVEDNPGRWLYHCHVFSHQDAGMAGWYLVE